MSEDHRVPRRNFEDFSGPTEEAREQAMRLWRFRHCQSSDSGDRVGGGRLTFGTPRKGKNTKFLVRGIRVR